MGVDTKAILRKGTTIEQIEKAISAKYKNVKVEKTHTPDFFYVIFTDGEHNRSLAVSFTNSCERENGISGVWVSLSLWENSVEICRYLCETFGGYLDENDCDDAGFYPINFHLYSQGKEFTKMDLFRHKVIQSLGYDNLLKVMDLFNEFKQIT